MSKNIIPTLIQKISAKQSIGFIKFGDGEYFCMDNTYPGGYNIDHDSFTSEKGQQLISAFNLFVESFSSTIYLGKWHDDKWDWEQFLEKKGQTISWANYHTLLLDGDDMYDKIQLYSVIKHSPLKKIYVGNRFLKRVQVIFNVDVFVQVAENNWFDNDFDHVLQQILNAMENENNNTHIVMTSAGMAAKILLAKILSIHPETIVLDFGSAFDFICTGRQSRTWEPPRNFMLQLLSEFIDKTKWDQLAPW